MRRAITKFGSTSRGGAITIKRNFILTDIAQGFAEEGVKERFDMQHVQTPVSAGGAIGGLLYKAVRQMVGPTPHTPKEAVERLKVKGATTSEAMALLEFEPEGLTPTALNLLMEKGGLSTTEVEEIKREKVRSRGLGGAMQDVVDSTVRLEEAKANQARAEFRAAQPLSFFLEEEKKQKD